MAISLQEELNKRNKDTRPYWVQFDEAAKAKSKKNNELREKGDKAASLAKAKNFTQQGITYSNLGFPATNIVDPSQARETAVRNELLRRENIKNKQKAVNARRDSYLESFSEWEKLAQRDDLESEEFAEKGRIFAEFGGDGTFIQERVDSINSLLESGVLSKEAEVGLTNTLEALVAAEGSFKESREQVFNIPDETVSNIEIENQYNPDELDQSDSGVVASTTTQEPLKTAEDIARDKWLKQSRNTPAAKAFADGTDQQKSEWEDLRWQARKRNKKLFDYNTDKEK